MTNLLSILNAADKVAAIEENFERLDAAGGLGPVTDAEHVFKNGNYYVWDWGTSTYKRASLSNGHWGFEDVGATIP